MDPSGDTNDFESLNRKDLISFYDKGLYLEKHGDYKGAASCFLIAGRDNNFDADEKYVLCMLEIEPNFNTTGYFLEMHEKYRDHHEFRIQNILLNIALSLYKNNNVLEALPYFLRAIKMNPESIALTEYYDILESKKPTNIYDFLRSKFLHDVHSLSALGSYNAATEKRIELLSGYCRGRYEDQIHPNYLVPNVK